MAKINLNLGNKTLFFFIFIGVALIVSGFVYAYGTSNPVVMGHSAGEISGLSSSFFENVQSSGSGCDTFADETRCLAEACIWSNGGCFYPDVQVLPGFNLLASTPTKSNQVVTKSYVDSKVGVNKARCPRYSSDWPYDPDDLIVSGNIAGKLSFPDAPSSWYAGSIGPWGMLINEKSGSTDETFVYETCTENADGTITFQDPAIRDSVGAADLSLYPRTLTSEGYYTAGWQRQWYSYKTVGQMIVDSGDAQTAAIMHELVHDFEEARYLEGKKDWVRDGESLPILVEILFTSQERLDRPVKTELAEIEQQRYKIAISQVQNFLKSELRIGEGDIVDTHSVYEKARRTILDEKSKIKLIQKAILTDMGLKKDQ